MSLQSYYKDKYPGVQWDNYSEREIRNHKPEHHYERHGLTRGPDGKMYPVTRFGGRFPDKLGDMNPDSMDYRFFPADYTPYFLARGLKAPGPMRAWEVEALTSSGYVRDLGNPLRGDPNAPVHNVTVETVGKLAPSAPAPTPAQLSIRKHPNYRPQNENFTIDLSHWSDRTEQNLSSFVQARTQEGYKIITAKLLTGGPTIEEAEAWVEAWRPPQGSYSVGYIEKLKAQQNNVSVPPLSNNPGPGQRPALAMGTSQEQIQRVVVNAPKGDNYRPRHPSVSAEEVKRILAEDAKRGGPPVTVSQTSTMAPQGKNKKKYTTRLPQNIINDIKAKQGVAPVSAPVIIEPPVVKATPMIIDGDEVLQPRVRPTPKVDFTPGLVNRVSTQMNLNRLERVVSGFEKVAAEPVIIPTIRNYINMEKPKEINQTPKLNVPAQNKTVVNNAEAPVRTSSLRNMAAAAAAGRVVERFSDPVNNNVEGMGLLQGPVGFGASTHCIKKRGIDCFGSADNFAAARAAFGQGCGPGTDVRWNYRSGKFVCAKKGRRGGGGRKKRCGGRKKSGTIVVRVTGSKSCRRKKRSCK